MRAPRSSAPDRSLNNLSLFAGCVAIWSTTWLAITWQLGVVAPEVSVAWRFLLAALIVSTIFENLAWHPLMVVGIAVSVAGNVLVLRTPQA